MKIKLFILMFFMILLVGTVSAELGLDNVKQYNEQTQTVKIVNSFGLGRTLAEIKLTTPLDNQVARGYQKVAELEFINFDGEYSKALDGIEFYDVKRDLNQEVRTFDYKYADKRYREVPIMDYQCNIIINPNQTTNKGCVEVVVGMENKSYIEWVTFNVIEDLPKQNIKIGIFTEVRKGDKIEWIPRLYGKKVDEWAVWTEALNTNLVHYYKLNDTVDELSTANMTENGGITFTEGLIGNNSVGNVINTGQFLSNTGNWDIDGGIVSFSVWVNATAAPTVNHGILGQCNDASDVCYMLFYDDGAGTPVIQWNRLRNGVADGLITHTTTLPLNGSYQHIVVTYDGTNSRIYFNGVLVTGPTAFSGSGTGATNKVRIMENVQASGREFNGKIDEVGVWSRNLTQSEITDLFNGGAGITHTTDFTATVTLNSPIDFFNTSTTSITFNATVTTGSGDLDNVTLFINDVGNATNTSGTEGEYLFTEIFSDQTSTWLIQGCNPDGCTNSSSRTFTVDTTSPTINITFPTGTIDMGIIGNETLNWTIEDTLLDSCWFDYNGTNQTVTCLDNTTTFNLTNGNFNLTMYANDTLGNINSSFTSWSYRLLEINQTFSASTIEGATERFEVWIQSNQQISIANLVYNGSNFAGSFVNLGGFLYNITRVITIPSVLEDVNMTFNWSVTLADNSLLNTTSNTQEVINIGIDDCSVFTTTIFNYTVIDEELQTNLTNNVTVEIDIDINAFGTTTEVINFSQSYNAINPALVCLNINLTGNQRYSVVSTVRYESTDPDHANEYYNIDNFTLQNSTIPQNIFLFDLLSSDSVEFQITFKDDFFLPVEGALVHIMRQYVSEGVFKTVEIPITDSNGQAVAHLVRNNVIYNIMITKGNKILGTFNNIIAFCQDIIIGDCTISLNSILQEEEIYDFETSTNLRFSLDYDDPTRTITLDFTTIDGSTRNVTLEGIVLDGLGTTTPCFESLTSSTGIITCVVPVSVGNATLFINIHVSGQSVIFSTVIQLGETLFFGSNGYFLMFFLVLSLALMFSASKTGTIIGVIIGFIGASALGLFRGGIMGIGSAVIWLIIAGIILIWRLNREGST